MSIDPISFGDPDGTDPDTTDSGEVIVTGVRKRRDITPIGIDGGGGTGATPGVMGSGSQTQPRPVANDVKNCATSAGAAVDTAQKVKGELAPGVDGPPNALLSSGGSDWRSVEFGAVVVGKPSGGYGLFEDRIYSSDQEGWVSPSSAVGAAVQGFWHNHPEKQGTTFGDRQQRIDRYPSPRDWERLASISTQPGAAGNPSIWLTGPEGTTREFKLSERGSIEALSLDQMVEGEGLTGKERTDSCN